MTIDTDELLASMMPPVPIKFEIDTSLCGWTKSENDRAPTPEEIQKLADSLKFFDKDK